MGVWDRRADAHEEEEGSAHTRQQQRHTMHFFTQLLSPSHSYLHTDTAAHTALTLYFICIHLCDYYCSICANARVQSVLQRSIGLPHSIGSRPSTPWSAPNARQQQHIETNSEEAVDDS